MVVIFWVGLMRISGRLWKEIDRVCKGLMIGLLDGFVSWLFVLSGVVKGVGKEECDGYGGCCYGDGGRGRGCGMVRIRG